MAGDEGKQWENFLKDDFDPEHESVDCPRCNAPMFLSVDFEIENGELYTASGHYDGVRFSEYYECPGCGYNDK